MREVTIKMDWHDALVMLTKLETRQANDRETLDIYCDGKKSPRCLEEEIRTLDRIIETVTQAILQK